MLTAKKGLAKTSQTPGKTQLLNHFLINQSWYLCDLPGYGYARVSRSARTKWNKSNLTYLEKRPNLQYVFQLIDSRLEPQKIDLEFIDWMGEHGLPFVLVFTKADKQSKAKTEANIALFKTALAASWESMPPVFLTSSEKFMGRDELLSFIEETNGTFHPNLQPLPSSAAHDADASSSSKKDMTE